MAAFQAQYGFWGLWGSLFPPEETEQRRNAPGLLLSKLFSSVITDPDYRKTPVVGQGSSIYNHTIYYMHTNKNRHPGVVGAVSSSSSTLRVNERVGSCIDKCQPSLRNLVSVRGNEPTHNPNGRLHLSQHRHIRDRSYSACNISCVPLRVAKMR